MCVNIPANQDSNIPVQLLQTGLQACQLLLLDGELLLLLLLLDGELMLQTYQLLLQTCLLLLCHQLLSVQLLLQA